MRGFPPLFSFRHQRVNSSYSTEEWLQTVCTVTHMIASQSIMTRTRSLTVAVTTVLKVRTCKENKHVGKKFDRKERKQRSLRKMKCLTRIFYPTSFFLHCSDLFILYSIDGFKFILKINKQITITTVNKTNERTSKPRWVGNSICFAKQCQRRPL
jgi:hypothetical protein